MLTFEEAKFNFLVIHLSGLVNFLPLKLNRVSGKIIGVQSKWRWMFFATNFVLASLYILNFIRTLIQSKFSQENVPINHFSVHIAYSFGMTADICRVAAFFFVQNEIVVVFNELYNNTSLGKVETQRKPRSFRSLSGRELLARSFIAVPIMLPLGYVMTVLEHTSRSHLLANIFKTEDPNSIKFKLLLGLEWYLISFLTTTQMFVQFVQLCAFDKVSTVAEQTVKDLREYWSSPRDLKKALNTCTKLQVLCRWENEAFSTIAYLSKMFGLATVISSAFYAIKLLHIALPDTITNACNVVLVFASFLGIYDKAFLVQRDVGRLAGEILVQSQKLRSPQARAEIRRALKAVRHDGVVIGEFYNVEREATLISIDFIVKQVMTILVGSNQSH